MRPGKKTFYFHTARRTACQSYRFFEPALHIRDKLDSFYVVFELHQIVEPVRDIIRILFQLIISMDTIKYAADKVIY